MEHTPEFREGFRRKYAEWLPRVRQLLEAGKFRDALASYPHVESASVPWTPLRKPLSQCRVAFLTTAGLYLRGEQEPFDAPHIEGDHTHRILPRRTPPERLGIAHTHYDHTCAEMDLNTLLPEERAEELVAEGFIGGLNGRSYHITGYQTRVADLLEETAPAIVAGLREDGADALVCATV